MELSRGKLVELLREIRGYGATVGKCQAEASQHSYITPEWLHSHFFYLFHVHVKLNLSAHQNDVE